MLRLSSWVGKARPRLASNFSLASRQLQPRGFSVLVPREVVAPKKRPFRLFSSSTASGETQEQLLPPKEVAIWLYVVSGMVFVMVVVGGLTRLTKSGLSMTDWKFTGEFPPISQKDWEKEFERYKTFPEYKQVHHDMTLSEFKFIFAMEWSHRMLGRVIGLSFLVPAAYFGLRGFAFFFFFQRPLLGSCQPETYNFESQALGA